MKEGVRRLFIDDPPKAVLALTQFASYKSPTSCVCFELCFPPSLSFLVLTVVWGRSMATDLSRGLAKSMHPADYWALEGGHLPELQFVAMRVLSKPVGIGSVERS